MIELALLLLVHYRWYVQSIIFSGHSVVSFHHKIPMQWFVFKTNHHVTLSHMIFDHSRQEKLWFIYTLLKKDKDNRFLFTNIKWQCMTPFDLKFSC